MFTLPINTNGFFSFMKLSCRSAWHSFCIKTSYATTHFRGETLSTSSIDFEHLPVFSGVPNTGYGSEKNCRQVLSLQTHQVLETFRSNQRLYRPSQCCDNIFYLIQELKARYPNLDLAPAEVLYVYSHGVEFGPFVYRQNYFYPEQTQLYHPPKWSFHVFLKYENYIFDFAYATPATLTPLPQYFAQMFRAAWKLEEESWVYSTEVRQEVNHQDAEQTEAQSRDKLALYIRAIPAKVYLATYNPFRAPSLNADIEPRRDFHYWLNADQEYPEQRLSEYLRQFRP